MKLRAMIWDVDGTLVDTERRGHLAACNAAFEALGIPIRWEWDEFRAMLDIPGNALRMRGALERMDPAFPPERLEATVRELAELKRRLYIEEFLPHLPLRAGVAERIGEALERGVRLAIVSTSDEAQIHALVERHLPGAAGCFRPILGKESGTKTAPESPLYRRCHAELGTDAAATLVIEDSEIGMRAALRAGLPVAVTYTDHTFGENFTGARLVASSLAPLDIERLSALALGA